MFPYVSMWFKNPIEIFVLPMAINSSKCFSRFGIHAAQAVNYFLAPIDVFDAPFL